MKSIEVLKANGSMVPFREERLFHSLIKSGASKEDAQPVVSKVMPELNASGSGFFTSEVIHNKFTWYSLMVNLLLLLALYEIPPVRNVLAIYPLSVSDWTVIAFFSVGGMVVNQVAKKFNLIKQ
jgi:hypothetical protein